MSVFSHMMNKEQEKIAILWKALEFYADPNNYEEGPVPEKSGTFHEWVVPVISDEGAKARKAFEEINDLPLW